MNVESSKFRKSINEKIFSNVKAIRSKEEYGDLREIVNIGNEKFVRQYGVQ